MYVYEFIHVKVWVLYQRARRRLFENAFARHIHNYMSIHDFDLAYTYMYVHDFKKI